MVMQMPDNDGDNDGEELNCIHEANSAAAMLKRENCKVFADAQAAT
jgi:hypothetical protein